LLVSPALTSAGYLLVFLAYASVLVCGRLVADRGRAEHRVAQADRRALLTGLVGAVAAGALARLVGRDGGLVASTLPLAVAPTARPTASPTAGAALAANPGASAPTATETAPA